MNTHTIITIGREYGSGGREVGETLAKKLGIPCYDKEILAASAKNSGFAAKVFEEYDETAKNSFLYSLAMNTGFSYTSVEQPLAVQLYLEQFHTIKELAQKKPCVFIGRCSDYVLRDQEHAVHVFAYAPVSQRIERICKRNQVGAETAEKMIAKVDKTRAGYYQTYTHQKWGRANHYNLCLDTGKLGVDGAVIMIEAYLACMGYLC